MATLQVNNGDQFDEDWSQYCRVKTVDKWQIQICRRLSEFAKNAQQVQAELDAVEPELT